MIIHCSDCNGRGNIDIVDCDNMDIINITCKTCNGTGRIQENNIMINSKDIANNRFYVGSNSVLERKWGHRTLEGAIVHAKGMIQLEGRHEEVFIVKIIKVVRRKTAPVEVIDVK
jgi:hypothetical protein